MTEQPNVLLIVTDQMRRDALGINRPGFAHTPHLDALAQDGVNFTRAYSACPSCIPARASLFTGLKQENHGFTGYDSSVEWHYKTTLPGVLANAGYHTQCVGKMHVEPARALMGFHNVVLHDGFLHDKRKKFRDPIQYDDYLPDVRRALGSDVDLCDTGTSTNGYAIRCWPWDERYHPTSWVTTKSIEFIRRRDTTKPFFLKVSYHRPHTPLNPPPSYFSMYDDRPMPDPDKGDWDDLMVETFFDVENPVPTDPYDIRRVRKAYCACVSQIDYELNRLFIELGDQRLFENTLIIFLSDHGDMLYDHGVLRKTLPFENSAGIPCIMRLPASMRDGFRGITDNRLLELRDIFPTVCGVCGVDIPSGLDGQNVFAPDFHHDFIHGEATKGILSNQWLTDGHEKYCWFSQCGKELLFDIDKDPHECHNLAPQSPDRIAFWRNLMIHELENRSEGYVKDGKLVVGRDVRCAQDWAGVGRQQ